MPDQETVSGNVLIIAGALAVLDQEVLVPRRSVLPQTIDLPRRLDVRDRLGRVGGLVDDGGPFLVRLAPGRRMRGDVTVPVPATSSHKTPVPDAAARVVGVVEIGETKQQVPHLVAA